jgi:TolB-like protein/Tfp pilus assembly protein PilF
VADDHSFLEELKRRHVWRVAIAYAVASWLLVQIATQVFPFFNIPDWTVRLVVVLLALGFPAALVLTWVYEMTPQGVRRTEPVDSPRARTRESHRAVGRKLDFLIIGILTAAVLMLGRQVLVLRHAPAVGSIAPAPSASIVPPTATGIAPAKSVAVLPFENLSNDKNNDYFVAGIQGLILAKLAEVGDLKVISHASTDRYASHPDDLTTVGRQLGVATILEGGVQKHGNDVLVTVQLVDADTDTHLWAAAYPRTLDNIFGVEGEVAEKIALALKAKLSPAESQRLAAVMIENPTAYDLFFRAEYQTNRGHTDYDTASDKAAIALYRQAIAQDSRFAGAYARLSYVESHLAWYGGGGMDVKQLNAQARTDADHALALQPDLAAARVALGYCDYWGRGDYAAALKSFTAALALRPGDVDALTARGYVQRRQGRIDDAIVSLQQAFTRDPRNSSLAAELGITYMMTSRYPDAERWLQHALALDPDNLNAKLNNSNAILFGSGDFSRALQAVQGDAAALKLQRATLLTYQRKFEDAQALLSGVPDTPDNFYFLNGSKSLQQANLYRLQGDAAHAAPLFAQALPDARAQLAEQQGINLAAAWTNFASAALGAGQTAAGLDATEKSQTIVLQTGDQVYGPGIMQLNAALYAEAARGDKAVPLLAKALVTPGIGQYYSPVLLWLDPAWDTIRRDPRFQALLKQYEDHRPAEPLTGDAPDRS